SSAQPSAAKESDFAASLGTMNIAGLVWRETARAAGLVVTSVNMVTFVAPNLAWGEARGGSIPRQWGCDRRATKPQAKFGATLRAAVLFGPGGVARSLQIHGRDMRVARSLPGPKTPRRKRHRIYALDHLATTADILRGNSAE